MSASAMGIQGEIIVYGIMAAGAVYSCGPNVIVGGLGTAAYGLLAAKDKVYKTVLELRLPNNDDYESKESSLANRIKELDESEKTNIRRCSLCAWSMIPLAGPFIALHKASDRGQR